MEQVPFARQVFCNRTLNLRAIKCIGYDMDYTLIHYKIAAWEREAYEHLRHKLGTRGWPLLDLSFDPELVIRGLIVDTERGNLLKANHFGYVKHAIHGTQALAFEGQRKTYSRTVVDLADQRFRFLNTFFSLSAACMYAQLVEKLDAGLIDEQLGYSDLYEIVFASLDEAHMEGELKARIMAAPEKYVEIDREVPLTLWDQKKSGKRLLLITNSEWSYTKSMMAYAFDPCLPEGETWRDLFDFVVVAARKPHFFTDNSPFFEVIDDNGLLRPVARPINAQIYLAGNARELEKQLGLFGDEILYVGDHLYTDVHVSKEVLRWRTALVVREIEDELAADVGFAATRQQLEDMMRQKERLEQQIDQIRLTEQRIRHRYPMPAAVTATNGDVAKIKESLVALDQTIAPLAAKASALGHSQWGPLMRAGNDKSYLTRQVERYADIYTSRVSNLLHVTPFAYLRAPRGTLPHDQVPSSNADCCPATS